jgi:hypothetical protein
MWYLVARGLFAKHGIPIPSCAAAAACPEKVAQGLPVL